MFYKETEFKDTEIGRIPKEWEVVKLGHVLRLTHGKRPKILRDGKFPVYGANGIMGYSMEFLTDNDFTLIIGRVGASGQVHMGSGKIWVSDNAIYSETYNREKVYIPFLFYLLKFKKLEQYASKSTHPIITQTFLNNYMVQLPKLLEQQKIAEILSTIDLAIQKTDEIINETERLKKGLMQGLLTKGIGHKEFKDTEIGRIPKEWEVVKLGHVLRLTHGKRPKILRDGKFPVYGANGIMGYSMEFLTDNDFTLIIGRVGASGQVHMGSGKIWVSDNAIYSETYNREKVYIPFLFYLLKFKKLEQYASKSTHPIITQTFLNNYMVQLPKLLEQQKIAEVLLTIDKKLELEKKEKEKLERIKQGLMDLLLKGIIRART